VTTKKPFPYQIVSIVLVALTMVVGWQTTSAVQGEKIKQIEAKTNSMCSDQRQVNAENSAEHKEILKALTRIETRLERPGTGYRR
jgi:hypothetical protein